MFSHNNKARKDVISEKFSKLRKIMTIIIDESYHGIIQRDIRVAILVCLKLLFKSKVGLADI